MGVAADRYRKDKRILELGQKYWQRMQGEMPSLFDRQYWSGQILDWIMEDESFKIDAFRFVDVLPSLKTSSAIASHVQDYLLTKDRKFPVAVRSALSMAAGGIASPIATHAIRSNITEMARRFICESDSKKAIAVFEKLASDNLTFTADILGEATTSDAEADRYLQKYLDLIDIVASAAETWGPNPLIHTSAAGPLPMANISVKISALDPFIDAADHDNSVSRLKERLIPLLRQAKKKNVFINFDLEQWAYHDITFNLFEKVALHKDLIDWPHVGLAIQAYLRSCEDDCGWLLNLSKRRGTPFTVRLVKGAYWDFEVVHARQNGFTCPVFTNKGLTDAAYEHLTRTLIDNHDLIHSAFASHNLRSLIHALVMAEEEGLPKNSIELQMLYGMAEPQRRVFAKDGYRVRVYAPIGELLPGMAYLVRRLLENTSNSGFLSQSYHEGIAIDTMLAPPNPGPELPSPAACIPGDLNSPFTNVHLLDFTEESVRNEFQSALEAMEKQFPIKVPLVINGEEINTDKAQTHVSPNKPGEVVSITSHADLAEAKQASRVAKRAFPSWRDKPLDHRAELVERLAAVIEENRFGLAALQVFEVGKPWREADADVAEAIDFCRYYGRQALQELGPGKQGDIAGEDNILFYEGRGPCVVIAPWNFPLAILCGMTTAALVAGNTVLIKPAGASTATAYAFYQQLLAAGFPAEVVQFLPGSGAEIGSYLVEHPDIHQIAFTGSREVGLSIIEKAGTTHPGQAEVKRVVCEMGGKNAIIIDADADIDSAIKGVMQSAFSYAGQKCSACSRIIIVGEIYSPFVTKLIESCRSLPIRPSTDPTCRLGPVINQEAYTRLQDIIANPPDGSELLFVGEDTPSGFFIPPALFEVHEPDNPLLQNEFFGPIITIIRSQTFEEALDIANSTKFALTGGVYSRSPKNMRSARQKYKVGNLYINRGCTGALVGRQPFGGFGMSGIGTKAGGPGYLLHFANPRCITENTMRSGFTPDLQM
jgi:RHH-type proline utilization regulon transcriptional repressor/proline dehydrogenase/delta 1-pyrroline-5-carboxylate dehydrogenase